ncbi:MAG: CSLREA domain-containing protein, partial [Flavobacteriales bacterium]|nr:CSLREA domain-containing protein [Flavobacteriales bacterium]
ANLYVGGRFTDAGGVATADYIARWNGSAWSALGSGVNNWVYSVAASETDVYVGGNFIDAGGVAAADHIAKWNGSSWSALGSGVNGLVYSIAVSETDVYVGGLFSDTGGVTTADNIAKWNGSAWSGLSTGVNDIVFAIALLGKDLYAGGLFVNADGITNNNKISRYQFTGQTILVTTGADEITLNGQCSLREAITAAQSNQVVDSCTPGGGHNTIIFSDTVSTITLNDHLPIISDFYGLTIDGGGDVQISGNNLWHPFSIEKAGLGIGLSKPILTLVNITIRGGHRASGSGGAITNDDGLVIIRNSNFTSNGSGVLENSPGGYVIISNSTFSFNGSPNGSGVINNIGTSSPAVVKIYNSTISANTSISLGAVHNGSFMYIYNSIIASNNGTTIDCSENLTYGATYGTNNLIELNQCSFSNGINGNIIGLEADLGSLNGSPAYFQLNPGSPAIDAGSNTICTEVPVNNLSQNGVTRPVGGTCDIGSFEVPGGGGSLPSSPTFSDVPMSHPYWADIEILYANGYTAGCSTTSLIFCPDVTMNRAQSAVFMVRGNFGNAYTPPPA